MGDGRKTGTLVKLVCGIAGGLILFAILKTMLPVIIIGLGTYAVYRAVKENANDD